MMYLVVNVAIKSLNKYSKANSFLLLVFSDHTNVEAMYCIVLESFFSPCIERFYLKRHHHLSSCPLMMYQTNSFQLVYKLR